MKRKNLIAVMGGWLALILASSLSVHSAVNASAATASAAGTLTGRVQNVGTGQYLNNARVMVRGADRVAFTDESGRYRLASVPAGPVVLDISGVRGKRGEGAPSP